MRINETFDKNAFWKVTFGKKLELLHPISIFSYKKNEQNGIIIWPPTFINEYSWVSRKVHYC
jgi:hypothetical protein